MFDDFDKKEKIDVEFQNPKFAIRVKNNKKSLMFFIIDLSLLSRRSICSSEKKLIV